MMPLLLFSLCLVPMSSLLVNRHPILSTSMTKLKSNIQNFENEEQIQNRRSQVLTFKEPNTGTIIKLVGCMHYNPASIQLAEELVEDSAKRGVLKAVLIESCPTRWEKMINRDIKLTETFQGGDKVYNNEMRAASLMARKYNVPTVLGDQEINTTTSQMKNAFLGTLQDLLTPFKGGWKNIYSQFQSDVSIALPTGSEYLGNSDFLDPKLIQNIPTSLLRYTSAFATKSPVTAIIVLLFVVVLPMVFDSSAATTTAAATAATATATATATTIASTDIITTILNTINPSNLVNNVFTLPSNTIDIQESLSELITSILGSSLELILVQRVFLNALLVDRNEILASNLLKICYSKNDSLFAGSNGNSGNIIINVNSDNKVQQPIEQFRAFMQSLFSTTSTTQQLSKSSVVKDNKSKEVIAILGMAHCNGIKKLLLESSYELTSSINNDNDSSLSAITVLYPIK